MRVTYFCPPPWSQRQPRAALSLIANIADLMACNSPIEKGSCDGSVLPSAGSTRTSSADDAPNVTGRRLFAAVPNLLCSLSGNFAKAILRIEC